MKIITDNGSDIPSAIAAKLDITKIPLRISFNGVDYPNSSDIQPSEFYRLLRENPDKFPTTSQPSVGQFVEAYEAAINRGQEIYSIHISSGLSGTFNTASSAAEIARQKYPDAKIHLWDTKTLSVAEGWQVLTAVKLSSQGKNVAEIEQVLTPMRQSNRFYFSLDTMKYLIHGGRISHLKGLLAMLMNIRPVITVDPVGKYAEAGKFISFKRALAGLPGMIQRDFDPARALRIQIAHGDNLDGVKYLQNLLTLPQKCQFDDPIQGDLALGAHTGESIVGLSVGYADLFPEGV